MLGHLLNILRNHQTVFQSGWISNFPMALPTFVTVFLFLVIPVSVQRISMYFRFVFPLKWTWKAEYLCLCFLAICPYLENLYSDSFPFVKCTVFLLLNYKYTLYIFWIYAPYLTYDFSFFFSYSVGFLLISLMVCADFLNWIKIQTNKTKTKKGWK